MHAVFSPKDRDTKKPRGFTFCQYRRVEDAEDAVKGMHGRVSAATVENCCLVSLPNLLCSSDSTMVCAVCKCLYFCIPKFIFWQVKETKHERDMNILQSSCHVDMLTLTCMYIHVYIYVHVAPANVSHPISTKTYLHIA